MEFNTVTWFDLCVCCVCLCFCLSVDNHLPPALLQSTVKLFFCPTTTLDSPVPRQTTLLASDVSLVAAVEEEL